MAQRPRIAITVHPRRGLQYFEPYRNAIRTAGGDPVDVAPGAASLPEVDGLLLPGGWDVDPSFYGEPPDPNLGETDPELDRTELEMFREARDRGLPVLGICRGQHLINVAMGGSLIQHLDDHDAREIGRKHLQHEVEIVPDSELARAASERTIRVNSLHHQAVKQLAPPLMASARGDDGVVEGVETKDGLVVAVQCHPEELAGDLPWARNLFARFVERARRRN